MKIYTKEWYNDEAQEGILSDERYKSAFIDDQALTVHDAKIISDNLSELRGNRLELVLDNYNSYAVYDKIIFNDYIIKENANIKNAYCLCEELYRFSDGRYEFHLLIEKDELSYFTVNCSSIEFMGKDVDLLYD